MNKQERQLEIDSMEHGGSGEAPATPDDGTFALAESFEGDGIPDEWRVRDGGSLQLSRAHYKHGRQSLHWRWIPGSRLTVDGPKHLKEAGKSRSGGMRIWVYSENAVDGALTFRLGSRQELDRGEPRYEFDMRIGFTGWRGVNVHFREDAAVEGWSGAEDAALEAIDIVPPTSGESGAVFFDVVEFVGRIPASRSSDFQIPRVRQKTNQGKGGTWDRSFYYSGQKPRLPLAGAITQEQIEAFATIAQRLEEWVCGRSPDLTREPQRIRYEAMQRFIRQGVETFDTLRLKRDDSGYISGLPLFSSRSAHGPEFGKTVSRNVFLPLVLDYKLNGNSESKRKALDLFDHVHDQGWAAGSGLETLDHETNRNNGYFHAFFLMRDELRQTGRLDRERATVHWFLNIGKTYGIPGEDYTETTADEVRTRFIYKLQYVLAMDNTPEKVRHMEGLLAWMNHALAIAPGYAGTIKRDYMGFHHRGVYMSAYAPNAYHTAALTVYLLHGTPFALSAASVQNVKQALLTLRTVTNKYDVPVGISGRFPVKGGVTNEILPAYAYMALAGEPADPEIAGAFMRLWDPDSRCLKEELFPEASSNGVQYMDTLGAVELMLKLADQGFAAENSPSGFWVKPSSALAVLRRDDWMVATKGWSQYVFDFEAHGRRGGGSVHKFTEGENVFGRYISYGAMQIVASGEPVNARDSGYAPDRGWDWRRWPGTTAKRVPLAEMLVGKNGSEGGLFNENTRSFSDETFVGGVESENSCGLFAMKLHDTVFDPSFRAVKSYFYFGSEIVALGSGIGCEDDQSRVETTLFQCYLPDPGMPIRVQSAEVTQFPYVFGERSGAGAPLWFTDPNGNGYVVADASHLHIEKGVQHSIDHTGAKETSGAYATAWFDHGLRPEGADYEYAILVQTPPNRVAAYADNMPYRVIQKNNAAHIVEHTLLQATGYAVFDETATLPAGPLLRASVPIMAYVIKRDGQWTVSVADPDLRLPKRENQKMDDRTVWTDSEPGLVTIELRGKWSIVRQTKGEHLARITAHSGDCTRIELVCMYGETVELILSEIGGNPK
ncbi:chondroitinase family polysaccharide lyase [Paenibacillus ginsengarvi]|uniref:Sugar lyase n=1 Tax=Paenibacillus ginsengarvi TaxID=400777 RepID=A0A3B0C3W6_9BACL|nr:chondroitinase family polysaccharide lyase [Paenibacillus ginsengarvi]RKN78979.1 sugar lyase [Paenibacillus ginsengarvi]